MAFFLGSFSLSPWQESPALLWPQSQPSSVCPVVLHPSSRCFLPSTPQHKRGHWPPQTAGKTSAAAFYRCRRTPASSGSTDGSVPSCRWYPCLKISPACHHTVAPGTSGSWPSPRQPPMAIGWGWGLFLLKSTTISLVLVKNWVWPPKRFLTSCHCTALQWIFIWTDSLCSIVTFD